MLDAQAAAGQHQGHIPRRGQGDGNPGGDHRPPAGQKGHRLLYTGVQVHGRRPGVA